MSNAGRELSLRFKHHDACLRVEPENRAGWTVTTYVDGRKKGTVHCCNWRHVELYRGRVQEWLKFAEGVAALDAGSVSSST